MGITRESCQQILWREKIACPGDRSGSGALDSNRILAHMVMTCDILVEDERFIDFATLDHTRLPEWVASLTASHKAFGLFIGRLKTLSTRSLQGVA